MGVVEILVLAVGLSMDAFAVSICKGLAMQKVKFSNAAICGIWFGSFQALMPLIGYFVGNNFSSYIVGIVHWIAFSLLAIIGGNMIKEAYDKEDDNVNESLGVKIMFMMAIATSIDALAVGVTFVCVPVNITAMVNTILNTLIAAGIIGLTTFSLSCAGVKIGSIFGTRYKKGAELSGGIVLVILAFKILIEHLIKNI